VKLPERQKERAVFGCYLCFAINDGQEVNTRRFCDLSEGSLRRRWRWSYKDQSVMDTASLTVVPGSILVWPSQKNRVRGYHPQKSSISSRDKG
jgi:hypothetical protein